MQMIISAALIAGAIIVYVAAGPRYAIVAGSGDRVWVLDTHSGYSHSCSTANNPCPPPPH
jgi:hypothetical protein